MDILAAIQANRIERRRVDEELPELVRQAFADGRTWQQIAEALGGVSKQRVYQLRNAK
ncbi:hypothetical protein [Mycolicibacterium fortuitum]|uniref:hypothetical protein n=1 Tax=Mycolicibacterium fortuitum TaxID=1766 RepID=UPI00148F5FF2|nr:hypothetical protein [Mycolicibacterium fortuitum]